MFANIICNPHSLATSYWAQVERLLLAVGLRTLNIRYGSIVIAGWMIIGFLVSGGMEKLTNTWHDRHLSTPSAAYHWHHAPAPFHSLLFYFFCRHTRPQKVSLKWVTHAGTLIHKFDIDFHLRLIGPYFEFGKKFSVYGRINGIGRESCNTIHRSICRMGIQSGL